MASTSRTPYRARPTPGAVDVPDRNDFFTPVDEHTPLVSRPGRRAGKWHRFARGARAAAQNNTGMLFVGAAQFFFALMNVWVKKLNSLASVPALELICVRMAITWVCCVVYMYITKIPNPILGPPGIRLLLALRGCCGFLGLFSLYYSLQYLSLSDATVLTFLSPIFTAVAGAVFLHERFTWREALAGFASLGGVVLIARPEFLFGKQGDVVVAPGADGSDPLPADGDGAVTPAQRLLAVCVALVGTLGAAGAYTTIRAIGKRAHALHNLVSFSTQSVVFTSIAMLALRIPLAIPTQWEWLAMLFLIGIFGFTAQVLLTTGLQRETAGRGTMAIYAQIVFAAADEYIFFRTTPSPLSVLGAAIILSSALYVALTKQKTQPSKAQKAEDSSLEAGTPEDQDTEAGIDAEENIKHGKSVGYPGSQESR